VKAVCIIYVIIIIRRVIMICKHCQAENADDAVFCKNCGKRLDGMVECPECKTLNPEDSRFCKNCGKLLSGKNMCQKCGTEYEGKFCPVCGTSADGKAPAAAAQPENGGYAQGDAAIAAAPVDTAHGWRKWVMLAGSIAGLVGVVLAVLFTYLIKIVPYGFEILGSVGADGTTYGAYSVSLGWLVGDALDVAKAKMDTLDLVTSFGSPDFWSGYEVAYVVDAYVPIIFTLIVLWATILTVVINAIIAIVRYVNVLRGKQTKSVDRPTIAAILTFIFGAFLIKSIWVSSSSASMMGISHEAGYKFDGATVAGIVLTCICMCLFIGSRIAVKGKELIKVKSIVNLSACALGIVFISVIWSSVTGSAIGYKSTEVGYGSMKASFGFPLVLQELDLTDINGHITSASVDSPDLTMITLMSIFGFIGVTLVSSLALSAMTKLLTNVMSDEKKSALADGIVLTVFSVIFLVISIVTINELFNVLGWDEYEGEAPDKVMTAGILAVVFAVLTLVVSIAEKIVDKTLSNKGVY